MDNQSEHDVVKRSRRGQFRPSGPIMIGGFFAVLATVLALVGLWRENNLSLRNILLGAVLGGGTWGLISWAIATAVVQVERDIASRGDQDE